MLHCEGSSQSAQQFKPLEKTPTWRRQRGQIARAGRDFGASGRRCHQPDAPALQQRPQRPHHLERMPLGKMVVVRSGAYTVAVGTAPCLVQQSNPEAQRIEAEPGRPRYPVEYAWVGRLVARAGATTVGDKK